jgi:hypothetical protein
MAALPISHARPLAYAVERAGATATSRKESVHDRGIGPDRRGKIVVLYVSPGGAVLRTIIRVPRGPACWP